MKKGVEYTGRVVGLTFPNKGKVDCGEEGMAVVKGTNCQIRSFKKEIRKCHWKIKGSC